MVLGGLCLGVTALFLPPIVVLWRAGCGAQFLINIGLTILGWIPGVLHAWYVILEYPSLRQKRKRAQEYRAERQPNHPRHHHHHRSRSRASSRRRSYDSENHRRSRYTDSNYAEPPAQIGYRYDKPARPRSHASEPYYEEEVVYAPRRKY